METDKGDDDFSDEWEESENLFTNSTSAMQSSTSKSITPNKKAHISTGGSTSNGKAKLNDSVRKQLSPKPANNTDDFSDDDEFMEMYTQK